MFSIDGDSIFWKSNEKENTVEGSWEMQHGSKLYIERKFIYVYMNY